MRVEPPVLTVSPWARRSEPWRHGRPRISGTQRSRASSHRQTSLSSAGAPPGLRAHSFHLPGPTHPRAGAGQDGAMTLLWRSWPRPDLCLGVDGETALWPQDTAQVGHFLETEIQPLSSCPRNFAVETQELTLTSHSLEPLSSSGTSVWPWRTTCPCPAGLPGSQWLGFLSCGLGCPALMWLEPRCLWSCSRPRPPVACVAADQSPV